LFAPALNSRHSIALPRPFIFRTVFENILDGLAKPRRHWKMVRDIDAVG